MSSSFRAYIPPRRKNRGSRPKMASNKGVLWPGRRQLACRLPAISTSAIQRRATPPDPQTVVRLVALSLPSVLIMSMAPHRCMTRRDHISRPGEDTDVRPDTVIIICPSRKGLSILVTPQSRCHIQRTLATGCYLGPTIEKYVYLEEKSIL